MTPKPLCGALKPWAATATRRSERGRRTVHPVVRKMTRSAMLAWKEITGRVLGEYGKMACDPS
jgi:hypothetical protein